MKDIKLLPTGVVIALAASSLGGCVVTPKKVASFDTQCMVATHTIELTTEQISMFDEVDCLTRSCKAEVAAALISSTFTATASAIVSGSIALVGNTLYWAERQGKCANPNSPEQTLPNQKPEELDEEYLLQEEIITAKS